MSEDTSIIGKTTENEIHEGKHQKCQVLSPISNSHWPDIYLKEAQWTLNVFHKFPLV